MSEFLNQVRIKLREKNYSYRTEKTYLDWSTRYLKFSRFPSLEALQNSGNAEIERFLSHLAVDLEVSKSTQVQALAAILFLYQGVLKKQITGLNAARAKPRERVPVVLSHAEAKLVLSNMRGPAQLAASLLYGSGLRLSEATRIRVKDLDFARGKVIVHGGKGDKDRETFLPNRLVEPLQDHLQWVKKQFLADQKRNLAGVYLPPALARKYPAATHHWEWQWVFPSNTLSADPRQPDAIRRHHLSDSTLQRAVQAGVKAAGLTKPASCHTFRHSFATNMLSEYLAAGDTLHQALDKVAGLLGHASTATTQVYIHLLEKGANLKSPLDR